MEIPIQYHIKQFQNGTYHTGYVKIDGVRFNFELKLNISIPELEKMDQSRKKVHNIFHLTLRKHGSTSTINLVGNEFLFFAHLLFILADKLYNDSRTLAINGVVKAISDMSPRVNNFGASVSTYITETELCDLKPQDRKMLSAPKFGCVLPVSP
jgi:hypothetical protein